MVKSNKGGIREQDPLKQGLKLSLSEAKTTSNE